MKKFGLVVIGAHFGVWLKDQINSVNNEKILLVEPVPYNYNRLKEDFKNNKNINICTNAVFSENKIRKFYKGKVQKIIFKLIGGLKSSMGYLGSKQIKYLRNKPRFVKITKAGFYESMVHNVDIVKSDD